MRFGVIRAAGLIAAVMVTASGVQAAPKLNRVKDVKPVPNVASAPFHAGAGQIYFAASDVDGGTELWSMLTACGGACVSNLQRVADLDPGPAGGLLRPPTSWSSSPPPLFTNVGGTPYFVATSPGTGREIWKRDDLAPSVIDLVPGPEGSEPWSLTTVGDVLYFVARSPATGFELWKYDEGVATVIELVPGPTSPFVVTASGDMLAIPPSMSSANGTLYFAAHTLTTGREVWKYDGTTATVVDLVPGGGSSAPSYLTSVGSALYFSAYSPSTGEELWKYDGTTATVVDLVPGSGGSFPRGLTNVDGTLYFRATTPGTGDELWKYDGTIASVIDLVPGSGSSPAYEWADVGGILYFREYTPGTGVELSKYDGMAATVVDLVPGADSSFPNTLTTVDGTLYFLASTPGTGQELWKYDGTTATVVDLHGSAGSDLGNLTAIGGALYFTFTSPTTGTSNLWAIHGPFGATPTQLTGYGSPFNFSSSALDGLTALGGLLYFGAESSPVSERRPWKSDGTAVGTVLLDDGAVDLLADLQDDRAPVSVAGTVYFPAFSDAAGDEPFAYDGATVTAIDLVPGPAGSYPHSFTNVGGTLYFTAETQSTGMELWQYDGTTATVIDVEPGASDSNPYSILDANGTLYFAAYTLTTGWEVWKYDGTSLTVIDIVPGAQDSNPQYLTAVNGTLYFQAYSPATGHVLWKYDGTSATVVDLEPGALESYPSDLTNVDGTLYFRARTTSTGEELWKYDGTTATVIDLMPGDVDSNPFALTNVDGMLYFTAFSPSAGYELWKYDGTTATVIDITPGGGGSFIDFLTNVDGTLYFSAYSPGTGQDLWKYDGTTLTLIENVTGADESFGDYLTNVEGTLFLSARDANGDHELWSYLASCPNGTINPGEQCDDGNQIAGDGCSVDCRIEVRSVARQSYPGVPITTDPGTGPTPANPVTASVTAPDSGLVVITEQPATDVRGYVVIGIANVIFSSAPTSVTSPLRLVFRIDGSAIPEGTDYRNVHVFRNGVAVPPCSGPTGHAVPAQCVQSRTQLGGGTVEIVVLAVQASTWTLAVDTLCPPEPALDCREPILPKKAKLQIDRGTTEDKDKLSFKWAKGADTPVAALGTPATTTAYALCLYDTRNDGSASLRLRSVIPAAGTCGTKPCWKTSGTAGVTYSNRDASPEGVQKLTAKAGATGASKLGLKARGVHQPDGVPPLDPNGTVVAQVRTSEGACFGARFARPTKSDELHWKAVSE